MKKWKIEIELELKDDEQPHWVYGIIEENLEDGESITKGNHKEIEGDQHG
jgi:hypothetical protein